MLMEYRGRALLILICFSVATTHAPATAVPVAAAPTVTATGPRPAATVVGPRFAAWAAQQLVPFRAPDGGTVRVDPGLVPAMTVLAQLDVGRPLLSALARGNVYVEYDNLDEWAHYELSTRAIRIDESLQGADPRAVAALLAHEASHAQTDVEGIGDREEQTLGELTACVENEHRATVTELNVWLQLFGPAGKQPAANDYEEQVNGQLADYLASPAPFRESAPREHGLQCVE
jgi:hypothetical protein